MTELKPMPEHVTIQVPAQAWNALLMKVARLETYLIQREREVLLCNLAALEDTFELPRTKEKRVR